MTETEDHKPDDSDDPLLSTVQGLDLPDFTESMQLVVEAQKGDQTSLDELLRRYEPRLRRIVRIRLSAKLRRCVESVDIVQETFRSAFKSIDSLELRSSASILQWLSKIAENHMLATHRRYFNLKRDRSREVPLASKGGANDDSVRGAVLPAATGRPEDEASRRELEIIVDDAVSRLPDDYREVIMLRTFYGGSWADVAKQMGRTNEDAARQLHRRARIRLARLLRVRLDEDGD